MSQKRCPSCFVLHTPDKCPEKIYNYVCHYCGKGTYMPPRIVDRMSESPLGAAYCPAVCWNLDERGEYACLNETEPLPLTADALAVIAKDPHALEFSSMIAVERLVANGRLPSGTFGGEFPPDLCFEEIIKEFDPNLPSDKVEERAHKIRCGTREFLPALSKFLSALDGTNSAASYLISFLRGAFGASRDVTRERGKSPALYEFFRLDGSLTEAHVNVVFGQYEEDDPHRLIKPGILSSEQGELLWRLAHGKAPIERVHELIGGGGSLMITDEQRNQMRTALGDVQYYQFCAGMRELQSANTDIQTTVPTKPHNSSESGGV